MAQPVNVKMWLSLHCLFLFLCLVSVRADTCVKKGPCRCEFENGTAIDLSASNDAFFTTSMNVALTAPDNGWLLLSYYFHPCKNGKIPDDNPKSNCTASSVSNTISCVRYYEHQMYLFVIFLKVHYHYILRSIVVALTRLIMIHG